MRSRSPFLTPHLLLFRVRTPQRRSSITLFAAAALFVCGAAGILSASTFAPSAQELIDAPALAADSRLNIGDLTPQVDSSGRRFYAVDDMRFAADAVERDAAFGGNSWPGGVVYYQFAASVSISHRATWRQAAAAWQAVAGVSFVESTGSGSYVLVKDSDGNSSYVGMIGGPQDMEIFNWNYLYVIVHEIGHALGLEHEHSRSDRDSYVNIFYANIESGQAGNFSRSTTVNYGSYDFDSVMHYYRTAFSQNGENTIEPKPAYTSYLNTMGQRDHLSPQDGAGMAQRYAAVASLGNDHFANRMMLPGSSGSVAGSTAGATRESGEPYHWETTGGASVWHKWTAPRSGLATVDTAGSNFDTVLAVYTGSSVSALTRIVNNDDVGSSLQSSVQFSVVAGVEYEIAVDGYSAVTGNYTLRWSLPGGPANDSFAGRVKIYGANGTISATNAGASSEVGEPAHAGVSGGASIWFSWTAPATGPVTFDTLPSDFDTLLGIYAGSSVGSLSYIASNDNAPGSTRSSVTFSASAGVTYQVAVDGRAGATGNVVLGWNGTIVPYGRSDFNGDGQTDLLWQNNSDGQRGIWFMNGTELVGLKFLPSAHTSWQIAGTGDFNGDGQSDIVWQNNLTGERGVWFMSRGESIGIQFLPTVSVAWQIATTGDFNGDGKVDIVWQNDQTGERVIWFMNGMNRVGDRFLPTVERAWRIAGAGDFTGDGKADLLWQNTVTGERGIWLMNGANMVSAIFLPTIPTQWRIVGTGNFNGDSSVDLIWQNDVTGERGIWFMNGTSQAGVQFLPTVATPWEIVNH